MRPPNEEKLIHGHNDFARKNLEYEKNVEYRSAQSPLFRRLRLRYDREVKAGVDRTEIVETRTFIRPLQSFAVPISSPECKFSNVNTHPIAKYDTQNPVRKIMNKDGARRPWQNLFVLERIILW